MRKVALVAVVALGSLLLLSARHRAAAPPKPLTVDLRRSLVIIEIPMLEGFGFERVLQALVDRSGATATTPLSLYKQWFDTQNPKPGVVAGNSPHCDDLIANGKPSFNGFPRRCPTPEGQLAMTDPFTAHDYVPIGVTNRFDLTPADGSNCGQYRIVYTKISSSPSVKLHVIFEAVLPNPNPAAGAAACRPVAQFWADLSAIDSMAERRARVEKFFFEGLDGFAPVLRPEHFTVESGGGIRTKHQNGGAPRFYQFHLRKDGTRLLVEPGLLETMPYGPLYDASAQTALGAEFRAFFVSQVATLAIRDVNGFFLRMPNKYLMTESHPEDTQLPAFNSGAHFNRGLSTAEGRAFSDAIAAELKRIGSPLTPAQVVIRADGQHCHGCHLDGLPNGTPISIGDGVFFPQAFLGSHVADFTGVSDGVTGFTMSPALINVFGPNRAKILRDFLATGTLPAHSN